MQKIQFRAPVRCPFCHDDLRRGGARQGCPECLTWHHAECLADHGRCASCGAMSTTALPQAAIERAVEEALSKRAESCFMQGCTRPRAVEGHCRLHAPVLIRRARLASQLLLGFAAAISLLLPVAFAQPGVGAGEALSQSAVLGLMAGLSLWAGLAARRGARQFAEQLDAS